MPICKIAFRTILRYGLSALVFLSMGLFFLFPTSMGYSQIQGERNQPYEIQATVSGAAQLEKYLEVESVEAVSPVISFNTKLTDVGFSLDSPVKAVSTDILHLKFMEGNLFPNQSNMPFLLLNSYAAKHFINESKQLSSVQVNDSVTMELNGTTVNAIICGIFEDAAESPQVYMSYYEAAKCFPKTETVNLLFLLTGKGTADQAAKDLTRQRVNVSLDENAIVRWELLKQQVMLYLITALGFLSCSIILMKNQLNREVSEQRPERQRLLLSGLMEKHLQCILRLRMIFAYVVCLGIAVITAWIFGMLGITSIAISVAVLWLHYLLVITI